MKKLLSILLCLGLCLTFAVAEDYFSVNDLEPASVKSVYKIDDVFSIYANDSKAVTIEALTGDAPERTAEDGEVFNARIKLNGSGAVDYRSVHFTANGAATLKVYTNSTSKDAARTLVVVDVASGSTIAELVAPPSGSVAGYAECKLPAKGEYAIYSADSGIYIFQLIVE